MRRCIGCKPRDWTKFRFDSYQNHAGGKGYATPKICLSAAYAWSRIVKHEYTLHQQRKLSNIRYNRRYKLPSNWSGEGVCIVMHDGSTITLGVMLKMYLPNADVKRYDKNHSLKHDYPPNKSHFIVMCEDGIAMGNSLCKMRRVVKRPIDLFLTIGGNKITSIPVFIRNNYKLPIKELVMIHHQLDKCKNVWTRHHNA